MTYAYLYCSFNFMIFLIRSLFKQVVKEEWWLIFNVFSYLLLNIFILFLVFISQKIMPFSFISVIQSKLYHASNCILDFALIIKVYLLISSWHHSKENVSIFKLWGIPEAIWTAIEPNAHGSHLGNVDIISF